MDTISLYIILPDSDEDFISIGDNIKEYMDIPKQFLEIKKILPDRILFKVFYSSINIRNFCHKADLICGGNYLEQIKSQMKFLIGNNSCNTDVACALPTDIYYYRWNIEDPTRNSFENSSLIISAAHVSNKPTGNFAIVSFKKSEWNRDVLPIIIDARQKKGMPMLFNIPYFYPYGSFIEWYKDLSENRTFSLLDVTKFERTNYVYGPSKRRIYKKISTGEYWYYDFFHKNNKEHFEVFDSTGNHKGEANINGVIDSTKRDSRKSISNLIFGQ